MRDLAKSAMSFSWAVSLFGMRQMTEALIPSKSEAAAHAFEPVTKAAVDTFGGALKTVYQAGDALQRGTIDVFFGLLSGRGFELSSFFTPEARQQAAEAERQAAEAAKAGTTDQGWGPVPPAS